MDTLTFTSKGVRKDVAFIQKAFRFEAYTECKVCHNKFLTQSELGEHIDSTNHGGAITAGGGTDYGVVKFEGNYYCNKCGVTKY